MTKENILQKSFSKIKFELSTHKKYFSLVCARMSVILNISRVLVMVVIKQLQALSDLHNTKNLWQQKRKRQRKLLRSLQRKQLLRRRRPQRSQQSVHSHRLRFQKILRSHGVFSFIYTIYFVAEPLSLVNVLRVHILARFSAPRIWNI